MNEQSKSIARRKNDWRFANRWFVGRGIDIGCGEDPLKKEDWPRVTEVVPYDVTYGNKDARYLQEIPDASFDFAHSSHCLEHLTNVRSALTNWLRVLKPGGFVICAVPEEYLYESGAWPSRRNEDHKSSFTMRTNPIIPGSIHVLPMLWKMLVDVEHVELLTEGYDPKLFAQDQTLLGAECAIEFVCRKPRADRPW